MTVPSPVLANMATINPSRGFVGGLLACLPIASGFLLAIAFCPGTWTFLAWICLIPLGIALRRGWNSLELIVGLYFAGLAFHLIHLDWIRSGAGATGLSGPRATQWLAQGMLLALMWPMLLTIGRRFVATHPRWPMMLLLPVVWVAFEYSRYWLWSIIDATGYPYGQLGLTQVDRYRLVQISDLGGVFALTALVAAVNGFGVDVFCWLQQGRQGIDKRVFKAEMIGLAVAVGMVLSYGEWRTRQAVAQTGPSVYVMPRLDAGNRSAFSADTNVFMELAAPAAVSEMLTAHAGAEPPELLIWSEGAYPGKVELDSGSSTAKRLDEFLTKFARKANATLVIGCDRLDDQSACYNAATVVDPRLGYVGSYDKLRLVPFNEFYPPGRPLFGPPRHNDFVHGREYPLFSMIAGLPPREFSFAVAICYDTGFPEVFRRYMQGTSNLPDFFVVPAFERHDRRMRLQWKLLALAQFRAIESRRAIVRNAESGYSGIIDGNGKLIAGPASVEFEQPVFLGRMPIDQRTSVYAYLGDWLPMGACGWIVASLAWSLLAKRVGRQLNTPPPAIVSA